MVCACAGSQPAPVNCFGALLLAKPKNKPGPQGLKHSNIGYWVSVPGIVSWCCLIPFSGHSLHMKCTAGVAAGMRGAVPAMGSCLRTVLFSKTPLSAGCPRSLVLRFPSSSSSAHPSPPEGHTVTAGTCTLVTGWGQGLKAWATEVGETGLSNGEHEVGSSSEGLLLRAWEICFSTWIHG